MNLCYFTLNGAHLECELGRICPAVGDRSITSLEIQNVGSRVTAKSVDLDTSVDLALHGRGTPHPYENLCCASVRKGEPLCSPLRRRNEYMLKSNVECGRGLNELERLLGILEIRGQSNFQ